MKKKLLALLLTPFLFVACSSNNDENNNQGQQGQPNDPPQIETVKYTVDFGSVDIKTTDSTSSKFNEVMVANINQNATILERVEAEGYAQINDFGDTKALIVSSNKKDGSLTFNFLKDLVSITITASPYKKYIDYSDSYSLDEEPVLIVNNETWNFETAVEKRDLDKIEKKFDINSSTLTIEGKAGKRVFIHSLEMEFIDEQD